MQTRSIYRAVGRVLRVFGLSQSSWNLQYSSGAWDCPGRSPETVKIVMELCRGGKLVEFGCGKGELPRLLSRGSFSEYQGYDISDVAIREARKSSSFEKTGPSLRFDCCDMAEWAGGNRISLIVLEECLYYLPSGNERAFLRKCCESLALGGSILVIVHDTDKHSTTLFTCREECNVLSEKILGKRTYLVLGPA